MAIIMAYIRRDMWSRRQGYDVRLSAKNLVKIDAKPVECKKDLICLENDCKGYFEYGNLVSEVLGKKRWQSGFCTEVSFSNRPSFLSER